MRRRTSPRANASRRAVAASELAVCLPVIVLLVLAMIESCTMIFLKQSLTVSAYEGVRTALQPNAVAADVEASSTAVLTDRRVQQARVIVTPANFETLEPGAYITVTVSAPADRNSVLPGKFFRGRTLTASATMMKEF
jgi:hypothetical protein